MAKKKKGLPIGWIILGGIVIAPFAAESPALVLFIGAIIFFGYKLSRPADQKSAPEPAPKPARSSRSNPSWKNAASSSRADGDDEFATFANEGSGAASFSIPSKPSFGEKNAARWIPAGESIDVAGYTIPGGMLYVGTYLAADNGGIEPALLNTSMRVAQSSRDFTERLMDYWPNYSTITPEARNAYLQWLAGGKKHPEADIGFVFLYFYGLERRAILDARLDSQAEKDRPAIIAEVRRLLGIYAEKSRSFRMYAGAFLEMLELSEFSGKLYQQPVPELPPTNELPFYLRLALGQSAMDGAPVPAEIALAWALTDPTIARRTPVLRCKDEFAKLFVQKYKDLHKDGIKLNVNRTKLKLVYRPASGGFHGSTQTYNLHFGDVPDVTALTGPTKKIQALVDFCTEALEAYSRYLGRNPHKSPGLESFLHLPADLWPEQFDSAISGFKTQIKDGIVMLSAAELAQAFGSADDFTKDKMVGLTLAFESRGIHIEPDLRLGAKLPKPDEKVALFTCDAPAPDNKLTPAYQTALLTLELASGVAAADGDVSDIEIQHLNTSIESWVHLPAAQRTRLKAKLQLLSHSPVSLASLKKKIAPLNASAKEAMAMFAAALVQVDGTSGPTEIKFLEKVYKLLELDVKAVYSNVHAVASSATSPAPVAHAPAKSFTLDRTRIAALQQDSDKVGALLSEIFKEESEPATILQDADHAAQSAQNDTEEVVVSHTILGMDETHSTFARMLLSRPSWLRDELNDVAMDLEIMLDGALERINEAALDSWDMTFTEGDDPIDINPDILEKINP